MIFKYVDVHSSILILYPEVSFWIIFKLFSLRHAVCVAFKCLPRGSVRTCVVVDGVTDEWGCRLCFIVVLEIKSLLLNSVQRLSELLTRVINDLLSLKPLISLSCVKSL